MKAEELRIGNLYDNNGNYFVVTPSTIESVFESERVWCKPIPLTEEWLLNFGFKQYETVGIKTHNYIKGNFKFNSAVLWIAEYKGIHIENKILYVHQLQNLYFALTGEELKLKN
jgi:hypothetical protein